MLLAVLLTGILAISAALALAPGRTRDIPPVAPRIEPRFSAGGEMSPDPGGIATLMLSPSLGPPGTPIHLRGAGFHCTARVILYWQYAQGNVDYLTSADASYGTFGTSIPVPADAPDGTSHIRAMGTAPGCSAEASFRVCRFCQEGALEPRPGPTVK
jgi:hypothetical protein